MALGKPLSQCRMRAFCNHTRYYASTGEMQIALVAVAAWQIKTGASPWDRARIFPIFFLGSAELASGLSGL